MSSKNIEFETCLWLWAPWGSPWSSPWQSRLGGRGGVVFWFFFFCLFWMMLKSLTQHYGNKVLTWIHKSKKFAVKGRCPSRAWCLMRWAVPARCGTNTQLCRCKCKGWAQQCRRTPGSWISCLCGFVMTPITALKLFLHVIYSRDVQFIFVLLAFFFMWKKKCIKIYKWSTIVFLATPQDSICSIQV